MSLHRQLWITIAACMALTFAVSFGISAYGARNWLEEQLAVKNADAARALALSMSQMPKDRMTIELQAATLFEGGQYALVRVRDQGGGTLVEMRDDGEPHPISALLSVRPAIGRAEIADGPSIFGTVELASLRDAADEQLQKIALALLGGFVIAAVLTGWLAATVLRKIGQPLDAIVRQARAIAERRLVIVAEPRPVEMRAVARAMNDMVQRLHQQFQEDARRLEAMRRAANQDELTGLATREYFLQRLAMLADGRDGGSGVLLLCRVRGLAELNRRQGRDAGDTVLRRIAALIGARAEGDRGGLGGRLNGTDFALLLAGDTTAADAARQLRAAIGPAGMAEPAGMDAPLAIAGVRVPPGQAPAAVLARADHALARAEALPGEAVWTDDAEAPPLLPDTRAWEQSLTEALAARRLKLVRFPTRDFEGRLLHEECFARLDLAGNGHWLTAGEFMPMATRLGLCARVDLAVAETVLDALAAHDGTLALNLCADSLAEPTFLPALFSLFDREPSLASRLWVEIPAAAAASQPRATAALGEGLRARGCRFGVERFGRDFQSIGSLHGVGLDYVKVDGAFIRGVASHAGNQQFLKAACTVIHGIGCLALAEGVQETADLALLPALGFDGATGSAVGA